jgi:hypothetical protein
MLLTPYYLPKHPDLLTKILMAYEFYNIQILAEKEFADVDGRSAMMAVMA